MKRKNDRYKRRIGESFSHKSSRVLHTAPKTISDYSDLSQFEEQADKSFLQAIGIRAAANAVNENKAMGIPVTFWQNGQVVRRMPDGEVTPLQSSSAISEASEIKGRQLKKGAILHVKSTH